MMPFLKSPPPICLRGINATLILYPHQVLFKAKGNIYPFQFAKPLQRLVALNHIIGIEQERLFNGGNLLLWIDDGTSIATLYAEQDKPKAQRLYQQLVIRLHFIEAVTAVR